MVREAIAITVVLLVSLVPLGAHAAPAGCVDVDLASFAELRPQGALAGSPGWERVVGLTLDRLPMTPTMLAVRGDQACDLTRGLDAFLGPAAAPLKESDALDLALFAVGSIYVDAMPEARLANGVTDLAHPVVLTPLARGYAADLTVWTPRNGVVADVHVVMDGSIDASFVVLANAVGPFIADIEGWNLQPGMTEKTLAGDAGLDTTKTLVGTAPDGKKWRITYFTQNYVSDAEADRHAAMHLEGALAAYANETAWGLVSPDPDGTLDVTLDGCDCIFSGNNANIHMFPRAFDILPLLPGLNYREESEAAELIIGHEMFHHFQYGIMQWRFGGWVVEGMARFSETANVPDFTFLPSTLTFWPNANGMNGFLLAPSGGIGSHSYDWSLVWGYLYAHEGGMPLMVRALQEMATGGTFSETDGPAAIQRAMDAVPGGEHATFAEAYAAFAKSALTGEGFVWGAPDGSQVHDWATYFVPIARDGNAAGSTSATTWGIRVHNARPGPAGAAIVAANVPLGLNAWIYTADGAGDHFGAVAPTNVIQGATDAALVIADVASPSDAYQYAIAH